MVTPLSQMSARRLRWHVLAWTAFLVLYGVAYALADLLENPKVPGILKDLIPVALAIPIASLAAAFNRRNSYLQALHDLWGRLVPAAQEAIQNTHLARPCATDFARTQVALSSVIGELRGVFKNVPASGVPKGLYPYENLKDIQQVISWLHAHQTCPKTRANARACIVRLWQEMHKAMLSEFDRDIPAEPVSKHFHWGQSVGDLLQNKTLSDDDLTIRRKAPNPTQR